MRKCQTENNKYKIKNILNKQIMDDQGYKKLYQPDTLWQEIWRIENNKYKTKKYIKQTNNERPGL